MAKKTRTMRVQIDVEVAFPANLETLPMGGPDDCDALMHAIGRVLRKKLQKLGPLAMGGSTSFSLDYRKPKKEVDHA